jgi:hypothetical protein
MIKLEHQLKILDYIIKYSESNKEMKTLTDELELIKSKINTCCATVENLRKEETEFMKMLMLSYNMTETEILNQIQNLMTNEQN